MVCFLTLWLKAFQYGVVITIILKKVEEPWNFVQLWFVPVVEVWKKDILRQTACMSVNPIMVDNFSFFFNCTALDQRSD